MGGAVEKGILIPVICSKRKKDDPLRIIFFRIILFRSSRWALIFFFDKKVSKKSSQPDPGLLDVVASVSRLTAG